MRKATQFRMALVLALSSCAAPAMAMDTSSKEAVRLLANEGAVAFEAQRYDQALEKFQRALDTAKVPTLALWVAQTQVKLGQLVSALESYRQVLNLEKNELWVGTVQQQAQDQAQKELAALQLRVPTLRIRVVGVDVGGVDIYVDGVLVPKPLVGSERPVDPGIRLVEGRLSGATIRQEATMLEGEHKELMIAFANTGKSAAENSTVTKGPTSHPAAIKAAENGAAQRTWGWTGLGVGAAGLVLGTVTGTVVALRYATLKDQCPDKKCAPDHWSSVDSYSTMQTLSTVGFIVAAVGATAGATLLVTSPKGASSPSVGLVISPTAAALSGSF